MTSDLGEALGIDLELEAAEHAVGGYSRDTGRGLRYAAIKVALHDASKSVRRTRTRS